ncbi:MAG: four helix bundle protein, partial [Planctomycetota bacterium]
PSNPPAHPPDISNVMRLLPHERLPQYRQAVALVTTVYRLTRIFPAEEKAGLGGAMRRLVTAIPTKIADAEGREDPSQVRSAIGAGQAMILELLAAADVARRLDILPRGHLRPLRKRLLALAAQLDNLQAQLLDELAEEAQLQQLALTQSDAADPVTPQSEPAPQRRAA